MAQPEWASKVSEALDPYQASQPWQRMRPPDRFTDIHESGASIANLFSLDLGQMQSYWVHASYFQRLLTFHAHYSYQSLVESDLHYCRFPQ